MCNLLRTKVNVFRSLGEVFGLDEAVRISKISEEMVESGKCRDTEAFTKAMTEIATLEYSIGKKLQDRSAEYGAQYVRATEKLSEAVDKQSLPAIVEAQQEVLLYVSIILADALAR
jgi:hypothetical protein